MSERAERPRALHPARARRAQTRASSGRANRTGAPIMSILRPRLAFALASLVLACAAGGVGCHKESSSESDDGDEPTEAPSTGGDAHEVARSLGLDANQEARFAELEAREGQGGHRHGGGRSHGARIERRVQRIARALDLTPQQT